MRLSWSGLWLLTLLLYTDVVNTSVSILNCPLLSDPDGTKMPVCFANTPVDALQIVYKLRVEICVTGIKNIFQPIYLEQTLLMF